MNRFTNISNSDLAFIIDEWVKGERDRRIMKRRLIDCICLEPLAEEFDLTVDRVKQIVYKWQRFISRKLTE
jgi:DNA-directed RNA polymerase sigma subunit (sigma70/sigma32)